MDLGDGYIQMCIRDSVDTVKRAIRAIEIEEYYDNDSRAVFYARGVLETVKKLRDVYKRQLLPIAFYGGIGCLLFIPEDSPLFYFFMDLGRCV